MDNCASKIIKEMSILDSSDDGIKSNQKYKYIQSIFQKECTTAEHLIEIYQCLNKQSLKDSDFAQKFAMLSSSRLFQTLELFGHTAKSLMMSVMKDNYENLDNIKDTDLNGFYNSIILFNEYYNRTRLSDGSPMSSLVNPLIDCFKVMLQINTERSAKEFTTHISLNGQIMNKTHPDEMSDLMIQVRGNILSKNIENDAARMWLMLCVDLAHNKFCALDLKLEKFYTDTLKTAEIKDVKKQETEKPKTDERHTNDVENSKNISESCTSNISESRIKNDEDRPRSKNEDRYLTSEIQSNAKYQNESQIDNQNNTTEIFEKPNQTDNLRNVSQSRPIPFSANKSANDYYNSNPNLNRNNSENSYQNFEKSTPTGTWESDDCKQFSCYRSKSMGKSPPTKTQMLRQKSFSNENFAKRDISPIRFNTRSKQENNSRGYAKFDTSPSFKNDYTNNRFDARSRIENSRSDVKSRIETARLNVSSRNETPSTKFDARSRNETKNFDTSPKNETPRFNVNSRNETQNFDTRSRNETQKFETSPKNETPRFNVNSRNETQNFDTRSKNETPRFNVNSRNETQNFDTRSKNETSSTKFDTRSRPETHRLDTRLCHNIVMKSVESNLQSEQNARKLLTPRERAQKVLSPHQALVEKAQRLSLKQNESSMDNSNNRTNVQNRKVVKAYLQDHNVENLTWNNGDHCREIYPEKKERSKFLDYLERR